MLMAVLEINIYAASDVYVVASKYFRNQFLRHTNQ